MKPYFQNIFLKTFILFLLKAVGCLEPFVNCVTNCVTAKMYPLEIKSLEEEKILRSFTHNLDHFFTNLRSHYQNIFSELFVLFLR